MAWDTGTFTQTAGDVIDILDTYLVANGNWSIYDGSAGTNHKVYRCNDPTANCDFYVSVDDNQANYAIIELWSGWNSTTHAGSGDSLTTINTSAMWIHKDNGGYGISVRDYNFTFVNTAVYCPTYIGQLNRYDTTKDMPIYIGNLTSTNNYNAIGYYDSGVTAGWACLYDEGGTSRPLNPHIATTSDTWTKTIAGTYIKIPVFIRNDSTELLLGELYGVANRSSNEDNGLNNGDLITISGTDWLACGGDYSTEYWCLVEKA